MLKISGSSLVYFDQVLTIKNIFDKLNRFLRYRHIKMRQWWNAEFHRFCILIWWYLKNIFSLSRTFCWAKLGQSVWLNCPIFFLVRCLLVLPVQDKMWQKKWKLLRENCPNTIHIHISNNSTFSIISLHFLLPLLLSIERQKQYKYINKAIQKVQSSSYIFVIDPDKFEILWNQGYTKS